MVDIAECTWYVQDPRHVRAQVGDEQDAENDLVVAVADDANAASVIVNDHNSALAARTKKSGK